MIITITKITSKATPPPIRSGRGIDANIDFSSSTVTTHVAVFSPSSVLTVIVAVPALTAVTLPEASTVATEVSLDDHVTFLFVASVGLNVTDNCKTPPTFNASADLFKETLST